MRFLGETLQYQEVVSVEPASLPIHRNLLKLHVRLGIDEASEDGTLDQYLREAVKSVEQDSGRALVMQTRKLYLDRWPLATSGELAAGILPDIELRGCPIPRVDSITYTDFNGAVQPWDESKYQVNLEDEPARVRYVFGGVWPSARRQEKSICVTYKAGYVIPFTALASTDVLTLRGYTPTNGERWRVSNSGGDLPGGLAAMTDYYVINASGATCKLSLTEGGAAVDITSPGSGLQFLGEVNPVALQAIALRVALSYADREGADHEQCERGYWSKIYALRYEGL